jgi:hypothetical protein
VSRKVGYELDSLKVSVEKSWIWTGQSQSKCREKLDVNPVQYQRKCLEQLDMKWTVLECLPWRKPFREVMKYFMKFHKTFFFHEKTFRQSLIKFHDFMKSFMKDFIKFHETQVDEISWNISWNFMKFHEIRFRHGWSVGYEPDSIRVNV